MTVLAALMALAVVLLACRSDSSGEPTDDDRELLQRVMLTLEDMPEGLQAGASTFVTNDEAATDSGDYEGELANYEEWGRILGYRATYIPGPEASLDLAIGVEADAVLFDDADGALSWFEDRMADAEAQIEAAQDGSSALTDPETVAVDARTVAADAFWVRTSGFDATDQNSLRVDNQILFRVEEMTAIVRVDVVARGIMDRTFFATEAQNLAQLMVQRMTAEFARQGADAGSNLVAGAPE
jgi:hypothetical protein